MAISARLTKGPKILDLSTAPYTVDFLPPSILPVHNMADGTSANRMGGADLVGTKYANREMEVAVRISGTSEATIRDAANRLTRFAAQYSDPAEKLYFEYKPNASLITPTWGQLGAYLCYEVVSCIPAVQDLYNIEAARSQGYRVILSMTVKPFALGAGQVLCVAAGGVQEDSAGAADGLARGLSVPAAGTNLFANPVYGNTTWNTSWTAGTGVIASQNTDPDYYLFGTCSVRVAKIGADKQTYYGTVTAGTDTSFTISYYAKRPDGGSVSVSDTQAYYVTAKTSTYSSVGGGWYRVKANTAGSIAANACGAFVYTDVYLDGFQIEAGSVATPLMHGDLLGHAWAGSAHNSNSTRTAGTVKLLQAEGVFMTNQGGACLVWTPDYSFNQMGTSGYLFASDAGTLRMMLSSNSSRFLLLDGAPGTAISGSVTITDGTPVVLHASWGPSGMAIYTNGTLGGTSAYIPQAQGTVLYIGGLNNLETFKIGGVINGFTLYNRELGSAEVLAHYNAISGMVSAKRRVDYIPWLWTKDGDSIVDNCADATRNNYAVARGIPGSEDADTTFKLTTASPYWNETLWLGKHVDRRELRKVGSFFATEGISSVQITVSGNSNDDAAENALAGYSGAGVSQRAAGELSGPVHYFIRMAGAAGTTYLTPTLQANFGESFGNYKALSIGTAYKLFYGGQMNIEWPGMSADPGAYYLTLYTNLKTDGSSQYDFMQWINGPLVAVSPGTVSAPYVFTYSRTYSSVLWLHGRESTYDGTVTYYPDQRGDEIGLTPGAYNTLQSFIGDNAGTHTITRTFTYSSVKVVPRWGLI